MGRRRKVYPEDPEIGQLIHKMAHSTHGYGTLNRITACFNLMINLFGLCYVGGMPKKTLLREAKQFHKEMVAEIESFYKKEE